MINYSFFSTPAMAFALTFLGSSGLSNAATLLVDFTGNSGSSGPVGMIATSQDFADDNMDVELAAMVNLYDGDVIDGSVATAVTGIDIAATITGNFANGFNATNMNPFIGDLILQDYIFAGGGNNFTVTVDGIEEFAAGSTVTLVAYSHGDQPLQVADLVFAYNGVNQTSVVTTEANPFVTFNFTKVAGVDSFDITVDNAGEGNNFAALNGFSLTGEAVPEPSSALLLATGGIVLMGRRRSRRA